MKISFFSFVHWKNLKILKFKALKSDFELSFLKKKSIISKCPREDKSKTKHYCGFPHSLLWKINGRKKSKKNKTRRWNRFVALIWGGGFPQWGVCTDDKCVGGLWQYSSGPGPSSSWSQNSLNELMEAFYMFSHWSRRTVNCPTNSGWSIY